jgi:hypothetical protein
MKLLPEGHGSYEITPANDSSALAIVDTVCPLCGGQFKNHFMLMSRLGRGKSDPDMRVHYSGIEPLHYAITTCPDCAFSAEGEAFTATPKRYGEALSKIIDPYLEEGKTIKIGKARDIDSVFKSYFLALVCTPAALERNQELACAGLWLKIAWLYEDCGDKAMKEFALNKTYEAYEYIYSNQRLDDKTTQQVAYRLGELNFKMGKIDEARKLFHEIKVSKKAPPTLERSVEKRLDMIRDMKQGS